MAAVGADPQGAADTLRPRTARSKKAGCSGFLLVHPLDLIFFLFIPVMNAGFG
jgi:hypothetical protein